jgi:putative tryptophan/tyrosine transport system substrate-binding protein
MATPRLGPIERRLAAILAAGVRRREFIALLGCAAVAWPLHGRAQQSSTSKIPRVGIVNYSPMWGPFREQLNALGYIEGRNISIESRSPEGTPASFAEAARELAQRSTDVLAVYGTPATQAAQRATTRIPIVMIGIGDPVGAGLVATLARPGGNITGNTIIGRVLGLKRLQLLKEVIPSVFRVALLWNPDNASSVLYFEELENVAPTLGVKLLVVRARNSEELDDAFETMSQQRPDSVLVTGDPLHQLLIDRIIERLAKHHLPAMYQTRENVVAGGFLSYGPDLSDLFRHGASYVHKILQGAKPTDLPVEQPTKFELVINLRTAKTLGLTISESFLLRADEVIE